MGYFLLLKTQYGTVQAALQYYRECCKALAYLKFNRNEAEPCVFYKSVNKQTVLFILWVDDCCICGNKEAVLQAVKDFTSLWDCKDLGELKEYVGCKVDWTEETIQFTQPVKVQRFIDEFGCWGTSTGDKAPPAPAPPGLVLEYNKELEAPMLDRKQILYRSGVGILLNVMRFSWSNVLNRVRELSRFMQEASRECYKALVCVMSYIVATRELGFTFRPDSPNSWDGKQ